MHSTDASFRSIFSGRRGRLLAALLLAEFGGAVQSIAYATVLPVTAKELDGTALYGATLAAGSLATITVLSMAAPLLQRFGARAILFSATAVFVLGVLLTVLAPNMAVVLIGCIVRGAAAGMLAGLGMSAIGGLYEGDARARVLALFAVIWLLPSILGPVVNAAITVWLGWRWAMAWPAVLVLCARLLVGRDAGIIPWSRSAGRTPFVSGAILIVALVGASVASGATGTAMVVLFCVSVLLAALATARILVLAARPGRIAVLLAFSGLCLAFFGGDGLVSLAVISGLGRGVLAGGVALAGGLVAWSLTGMRPPSFDRRLGDAPVLGLALLAAGLGVQPVAQLIATGSPDAALAVVVIGWFVAGCGMGLAYPRLISEPFDGLAAERVTAMGTAVAFAETSATTIGSLVGGGTYSLATSARLTPQTALVVAFTALAAIAVLVTLLAGVRSRVSVPAADGP